MHVLRNTLTSVSFHIVLDASGRVASTENSIELIVIRRELVSVRESEDRPFGQTSHTSQRSRQDYEPRGE